MDSCQQQITFYVNGLKKVVHPSVVDPECTLLRYLRDQGLTGTKLGCGEGGCGACTVLVSHFDSTLDRVVKRTVNACLAPLYSVNGCNVTTIEGLGSTNSQAHIVQEKLAKAHGSQCGFCTPGIAMSMYAMLQKYDASQLTEQVVEHAFDGNLCRCTGYRPILDAAKSFVAPELRASGGGGCCSSSTSSSTTSMATKAPFNQLFDREADEKERPFPAPLKDALVTGPNGTSPSVAAHGNRTTWYAPSSVPELLTIKAQHNDAKLVVGNSEIGIETKFKGIHYPVLVSTTNVRQLANMQLFGAALPPTLDTAALAAKRLSVVQTSEAASPLLSVGGETSVTLDDLASSNNQHQGGLLIGGSATLGFLKDALDELVAQLPRSYTRGFSAMSAMLNWFASSQIRNVASLAGNIATASPISDMNPILIALNARVILADAASKSTRAVLMQDFFISYRKVDMRPTEIILSVFVPLNQPLEYVRAFKQAKRRDDDISIVTGCFRVRLAPQGSSSGWTIQEAGFGFGGMAPKSVPAPETVKLLTGKPFTREVATGVARDGLIQDLPLPPDVPGGMSEYRRTLALSFWHKFFIDTSIQLAEDHQADASAPPAPAVSDSEKSAANSFLYGHREVSQGVQDFEIKSYGAIHRAPPMDGEASVKQVEKLSESEQKDIDPNKVGVLPSQHIKDQSRGPVGKPLMHRSAILQCTGEAQYIDDIPAPPGLLHAALVLSDIPKGTIKSVDPSPALAVEGVVSYFGAKDVPGSNKLGPVFKDEEVFATEEIVCVGQPIGVIVATTVEVAQRACKLVKVEYDVQEPVLSIQDAIDKGSFHDVQHTLESGDVNKAFQAADTIIVQGERRMGGQEHFYLETNATLAVPGEGNTSMVVHVSTQNTMKSQNFVASSTGIPSNRVVCKMKRMGGGFGGKETRSVYVSCAAAVAAKNLNRPVKLFLDRDVDIATSGQRHAFVAKYKASATRDGKITGLDVKLYCNAGCSFDLTGPVMDRALFHVDNCYKIPNLRAEGYICMTNLPSNTAFRGFGGPQGLMVAETYINHLAAELNMSPRVLRRINLYKEGEQTHFDQPVLNNPLQRMFTQLERESDIEKREAQIKEFNANNKFVKRGIDLVPVKFGISFTAKFMNQGGALVHVYTDGTVLVSHGGTEMGQGLHTKVIQVAARAFGISVDAVHIEDSSSDKVPNASPTAASMSSDLYGMATLDACEQIMNRLKPVVQRMKANNQGTPQGDDVANDECIGGSAYLDGLTFQSVVQQAYMDRVNLSAQGFYKVPDNMCGYDWDKVGATTNAERGCPFNYFTFGTAVTEVELDVLTGDLLAKRVDVLMDLGKSLNPAIDVGQIEGAFMQGLGLFTMEEFFWGNNDYKWVRPGHIFTKGPGTYKIPSFNDVPLDFRISLLKDAANPRAVHSSKAVGEPPLFLGSSVFWAAKQAVQAARAENGSPEHEFFALDSPATCERLRMACADDVTALFAGGKDKSIEVAKAYRPKGCF